MSGCIDGRCSTCGQNFFTVASYNAHTPQCLPEAVREEREAVVRYLRTFGDYEAKAYARGIERGEHRK